MPGSPGGKCTPDAVAHFPLPHVSNGGPRRFLPDGPRWGRPAGGSPHQDGAVPACRLGDRGAPCWLRRPCSELPSACGCSGLCWGWGRPQRGPGARGGWAAAPRTARSRHSMPEGSGAHLPGPWGLGKGRDVYPERRAGFAGEGGRGGNDTF